MKELILYGMLVVIQVVLYVEYFKIIVDGVDHTGWNRWDNDRYNHLR